MTLSARLQVFCSLWRGLTNSSHRFVQSTSIGLIRAGCDRLHSSCLHFERYSTVYVKCFMSLCSGRLWMQFFLSVLNAECTMYDSSFNAQGLVPPNAHRRR